MKNENKTAYLCTKTLYMSYDTEELSPQFVKGKEYYISGEPQIDLVLLSEVGHKHTLGGWEKHFKVVRTPKKTDLTKLKKAELIKMIKGLHKEGADAFENLDAKDRCIDSIELAFKETQEELETVKQKLVDEKESFKDADESLGEEYAKSDRLSVALDIKRNELIKTKEMLEAYRTVHKDNQA